MSNIVNTNVAAALSSRHVRANYRSLHASNTKLASGNRITHAGDDAAGLAVAENLQAANRSTRMAIRNINDGSSLLNVAEKATGVTGDILIRMRELAVQSSSEVLNDQERAYLVVEYDELVDEIDRLANVTQFNGRQLIDGNNNNTVSVQVGIHNTTSDRVSISLGDISVLTLGVHTSTTDVQTVSSARLAIEKLDRALDTINKYMSNYGAISNKLSHALDFMDVVGENLSNSEGQIRNVDMALEATKQARFQILSKASISVLAQAGQIGEGAMGLV